MSENEQKFITQRISEDTMGAFERAKIKVMEGDEEKSRFLKTASFDNVLWLILNLFNSENS